jgi:hypothetical protein
MAMFPFAFTVVFYDEYDEENHKDLYRRESGMGIADSYADAMKSIENYYGTDLVAVKHLELFEENELILMSESCIKEYAKNVDNVSSIACDVDGNPTHSVARDVLEKGSNVYEC